jgi:hypothetical protein
MSTAGGSGASPPGRSPAERRCLARPARVATASPPFRYPRTSETSRRQTTPSSSRPTTRRRCSPRPSDACARPWRPAASGARSSSATTARPTAPPRWPAAAGARVVFEPVRQISRARNAGARAARRDAPRLRGRRHAGPAAAAARRAARPGLRARLRRGGGGRDGGVRGGVAGRMVWLWNAVSRGRRLAAGSFVFVRREAFEAVGRLLGAGLRLRGDLALPRGEPLGATPGPGVRDPPRPPVVTSGRKARWYPAPLLLAVAVGFLLFPFLVRSRRFCWLWYRRPARELC